MLWNPAEHPDLEIYGVMVADWRNKVYDWYTMWAKEGWCRKKKQLFLYGPTNSGKTEFIIQKILGI